ncbi:sushi domain-containing protein 5 [Archocentrus centrarchus]|uniref:sushi domain-containing protein 5 n=1 Tax=Archocentrus centrarchus TaxID=63155 RepID=UPI0011E9BA03|nr:sushi domain-containing protein 5 [Archocentrus centrarchus]
MLDRYHHKLLLFGCLACLLVTVVNGDGRVFVLDVRNSSGLQGFRDAKQACSSQHGRLASVEELRHAVVECFFSPCTRGWLYGGSVGTTVCDVVGGVLKAIEVRIENATEDAAHLDAFCIKGEDEPCGDPPAFPNAHLHSHSGSEMGDELLYTCVPGYVMPSGQTTFSLLCDSCREWYGLVQICVKEEAESHTDYEDKFTDSYVETERHPETPVEAHGSVHEEVHGAAYPHGERSVEQQETSFRGKAEEDHQGKKRKVGGEVADHGKTFEGASVEGEKNKERAVEDFIGHQTWEQERTEVVKTDRVEATEAPVSLLSQKHMFWFPSETFQEEEPQVFTNPATQTTLRTSGAQSEESNEHTSQERPYHQRPVDVDIPDHERDDFDDPDTSRHDDQDDIHEDGHQDQDDGDSYQEEDHDDNERRPAQHEELDRWESHENYDDHKEHYDMGEHEEDRDRIHYGSKEYDDGDDTYDEHKSHEDHGDDHDDHNGEHHDVSEEHLDHDDHDDGDKHYDDNHYVDPDDHDDREHKDTESYDDHNSREDDSRQHVIFSVVSDEHQNVSQRGAERKSTTDDAWLDGYPVDLEDGDSTTEKVRPEDKDRRRFVKTTPRPNEVEIHRPAPYTSSPEEHESPTTVHEFEVGVLEKLWPDSIRTPTPDHLEPSDSPSYSKTGDYSTQQAVPTDSWMGDLTEQPFLDHGPNPPVRKDGFMLNLPGETGERGELEGEKGETICVDGDCPPHPPSSSSRGPTVAAIIVAICAVATAVIVAVWCYRRQQQKSSAYEMNGKGQSQTRQGQQIEMQQKV